MTAYDRKDSAYRTAKREGLRSRAAMKLRELDDRFHFLLPGRRVLELGCWPGGWLQIAARRVGRSGAVVGVDLVEVEPLGLENVRTIAGDVRDREVLAKALDLLGGRADVLLSDLAPKLSGVKAVDNARHEGLVRIAVEAAGLVLVPSGGLLVKLFSSCEADMTKLLRSRFEEVTKIRPDSTRKGSSELYGAAYRCRPAPQGESAVPSGGLDGAS